MTHASAADGDWVVRKTSGEVWTGGAQPVALGAETVLKPGDTVTTGRNGRVLLVRGQETILIAPNSIIGIPADKKDGLATTITQRAGSILLEVEKKNVPHFEVETPYLAAVVKGTQFRVSVTEAGARVEVTRGKVQVADFKSGQIAQVLPGQAAETHVHSTGGLHLSGVGTFLPVEHGAPRNSTIEPIKVPKGGLQAPQGLERARSREAARTPAQGKAGPGLSQNARHNAARPSGGRETRAAHAPRPGVIRISKPLGELHLNAHKVTHGLVRNTSMATDSGRRQARESTIWNSDNGLASAAAMSAGNNANNGAGNGNGGGGGMGGGSGSAGASGSSAVAAAVAAGGGNGNAGGNGNGNGNGNAGGNGNGNGKVAGTGGNGNGNGNAGGNGAGNGNGSGGNGNGNGNGGVGNGNGKGNTKH